MGQVTIAIGDSNTDGRWMPRPSQGGWVARVKNDLPQFGQWENWGVQSSTSDFWMDGVPFVARYYEDFTFQPMNFVILTGNGDAFVDGIFGPPRPTAEVVANYTTIITEVWDLGATPYVIPPLPLPALKSAHVEYREAIEDLSTEMSVPWCPYPADIPGHMVHDGIHLNAAGQRWLAHYVHEWLKDFPQPNPNQMPVVT